MPYGKDTASRGHEGPWPDLRAYAPQPARGPTKGKGEGAGWAGAVEWVRGAVL